MKYETIPETVEATQQQIVPCKIGSGDTEFVASPGDWIVKRANGNIEVYSPNDFTKMFRAAQVAVKDDYRRFFEEHASRKQQPVEWPFGPITCQPSPLPGLPQTWCIN